MTERPIIFSIDMVRAIFEGRKTQTRRIVSDKASEALNFMGGGADDEPATGNGVFIRWAPWDDDNGKNHAPEWVAFCAEYPEEGCEPIGVGHGNVGDRLWVRESHYRWNCRVGKKTVIYLDGYLKDWGNGYETRIDLDVNNIKNFVGAKTPSIHMPRWASRLTLAITKVRVQRIQEISREDVEREGCSNAVNNPMWFPRVWDRFNAKRGHGWDANPWVWVIEFPPLRC